MLELASHIRQATTSSTLEVKRRSTVTCRHMSELVAIGDLARRSGVAVSALRFYEDRGLIQSVRNPAGHRRYERATLRRVAFIVFAQHIGLSLGEIGAELRRLPDHRTPTRRDWTRLSRTWTARIDQRIAELQSLRAGLTECIGCGCLSMRRCALANPQDKAAQVGAGPSEWAHVQSTA